MSHAVHTPVELEYESRLGKTGRVWTDHGDRCCQSWNARVHPALATEPGRVRIDAHGRLPLVVQLAAPRHERGRQAPSAGRSLSRRHSCIIHPGGTELAGDWIRLHKEKVLVQNHNAERSIIHGDGHTLTHGPRRLPFVQAIHSTVEKRMNAFESDDLLVREVALSFGAVHAGHEDRRFCSRIAAVPRRRAAGPYELSGS